MNKLPELPRVLKQREATFGVKLKAWFEKNPRATCAIETKDTRGKNYFNFSELSDEQIAFGMSVKSEKGTWIRVQGLHGEPDYIWMRNEPSFVIIKYPKLFVAIDVETLILEKERSKKKSLTVSRAKDICIFCA